MSLPDGLYELLLTQVLTRQLDASRSNIEELHAAAGPWLVDAIAVSLEPSLTKSPRPRAILPGGSSNS
jgi:hypothetical protein